MRHKIYVASSWRNEFQPGVVAALQLADHEVYDFRNPKGRTGFAWSQIDPLWEHWTTDEYRAALRHPLAVAGYASDFSAMNWADLCVLVLPAGRSANIEAGWMCGRRKGLVVYQPVPQEPELMYKMADAIVSNQVELLRTVAALEF